MAGRSMVAISGMPPMALSAAVTNRTSARPAGSSLITIHY